MSHSLVPKISHTGFESSTFGRVIPPTDIDGGRQFGDGQRRDRSEYVEYIERSDSDDEREGIMVTGIDRKMGWGGVKRFKKSTEVERRKGKGEEGRRDGF